MADSTTPNYGFTLPTPGDDLDTWGDLLNANWASLDTELKAVSNVANAALPLAGGTVTGLATFADNMVLTGGSSTPSPISNLAIPTMVTMIGDGSTTATQIMTTDYFVGGTRANSRVMRYEVSNTGNSVSASWTGMSDNLSTSAPFMSINGRSTGLLGWSLGFSSGSPIGDGFNGVTWSQPSGTFTINTSVAIAAMEVGCPANSSLLNFYLSGGTGTGAGLVGSISHNGTSTTYGTTSDYRRKENVQPLAGALVKVLATPVHTFNFIGSAQVVGGFLAHEAQVAVPEAVVGQKDAVDAQGKPVYQQIDQSKLVPVLWGAVQELTARVAALEAKASA